ncbi:hypothetical protein V7122_24870 [Bacillus sp. JJ1532]|uniref:hypothetical protein n=1 Tax=unclassified Bacillus (in: firmicutes) TaxID=185979 RepID=UPI002FFDDB3E
MVRTAIAGIGGFILVFFEAYIVMVLKGYYSIEFGGLAPFISVWAMNAFLVFTILTHLKLWYENRESADREASVDR